MESQRPLKRRRIIGSERKPIFSLPVDRLFDGDASNETHYARLRKLNCTRGHKRNRSTVYLLQRHMVHHIDALCQLRGPPLHRVRPCDIIDSLPSEILLHLFGFLDVSRWWNAQSSGRLKGVTSPLLSELTRFESQPSDSAIVLNQMMMQAPKLTELLLCQPSNRVPVLLPKFFPDKLQKLITRVDSSAQLTLLMKKLQGCEHLTSLEIEKADFTVDTGSWAACRGLTSLTLRGLKMARFSLQSCAPTLQFLTFVDMRLNGNHLQNELKSCLELTELWLEDMSSSHGEEEEEEDEDETQIALDLSSMVKLTSLTLVQLDGFYISGISTSINELHVDACEIDELFGHPNQLDWSSVEELRLAGLDCDNLASLVRFRQVTHLFLDFKPRLEVFRWLHENMATRLGYLAYLETVECDFFPFPTFDGFITIKEFKDSFPLTQMDSKHLLPELSPSPLSLLVPRGPIEQFFPRPLVRYFAFNPVDPTLNLSVNMHNMLQ